MKEDLKDLIIDGATVIVDRGEGVEKEFLVSRNIGSALPWVVGYVIDGSPETVTDMDKLVEKLFTMIDDVEKSYGGRCERAAEPLEGYKTMTINTVKRTLSLTDGREYELDGYLDTLRKVTGRGLGTQVINRLVESLVLAGLKEAVSGSDK